MAHLTGGNVLWRRRFAEITFDLVHRSDFKHQAADVLSRLEATGDDQTSLDDVLPLLHWKYDEVKLYEMDVDNR